ncbi:helix-turn-helix domain-containing protein, partial [Enterococcus avium]
MTGKFFQEFREKKNQSIMNTSEGIVTPQFLRKYERENGDIRFSNLLQLLGRLNITFDEFVFEIDDSMDVWLYKIEEEIDQAYHAGNSFLLKKFVENQEKLYRQTNEERFLFAALIGKRFYNYIF